MCPNGRWRGFASPTRDWRCPSPTQVGQTAQDNCLRWQLAGPPHSSRRSGCQVDAKNCTSDSCSQWSPRSYCCPETSAKQETAKKQCCIRQAHSLTEGWTAWIVSWVPSQAPPILSTTLRGPPGLTVQILIVPNINRFMPPSAFPTTRGVRSFNRMELLAVPQVPLWSLSGGRRSRSFRDGQHSLQIWILLSISVEEWRRKLGGPSQRTWRIFGMPARWPSMPSPMTSSTSSTTLCQTGWQLFCRPKEPIQDINYLTFSPWWNTRLIFHLLFY